MFSFFRPPFFLPWVYPGLLWRITTNEKELYLTFDDGPVPGPTEFVLDELKKSGCAATFFCIGDNVRKHGHIFKKIIEQGHAVGNHTFNHLSGWKTGNDRYVDNVKACQDEMAGQTSGAQFPLFRPPYGRIRSSQIRLLSKFNIVMWDVLTHDYEARLSSEACLSGSIRATRPGSIIVFHDSIKAEKNLTYVLPRFISHFKEQGFNFKSLA